MNLSTYGYGVGGVLCLVGVVALTAKGTFLNAVESFPRHTGWGRVLAALAVGWTAWILFDMSLGWFEPYKNSIYLLAPLAYILIALYLDELLAPRMLGVLLLLAAAPVLDTARWHESPWRLILTVLVYIWVVCGIILVLSPYRFRKTIEWWTRNDFVFNSVAIVLAGLGILLIGLAAVVY